jgi:aminopeptidase N
VKPEEDQAIWWIPLGLQTKSLSAQDVARALTTKSDIVRNVDLEFYKLNKDQSGFYRTNYPPSRLAQLGHQLDLLSVEDRIGLVGDASALAISGEGTTPAVLALLEGFQNEQNYL